MIILYLLVFVFKKSIFYILSYKIKFIKSFRISMNNIFFILKPLDDIIIIKDSFNNL